ncbi:hypothetical protein NBRC10513v2_007703 [Rhodotorula toruloides]|uniref:BY PROTMAP: gi/472581766/gb/EMS19481.1/ Rho GTPase-activating protein [Rhodosporidium toruloides NP11] gi/647402502/emb/CDR48735.1/ RHTO0S20e00232g1_1 [Rhodosporidium toruloides] n=1 Tax=Rhodotorula toruloides TaxID=5286 RepID=A0A0K3CMI6_RHOTO
MSANGWGGTLSAMFGGGGNGRGGASGERGGGRGAATVAGPGGLQQKQKADVRRRLPDWSAGDAGVEVGQPKEEDSLEDGEGTQDPGNPQLEGDQLDRLAAAILWQAGTTTDTSPHPLLAVAASRIPPPSEVSHPDLLTRLRLRLEQFAERGRYSVVLFVNPAPNSPSTAHLVAAYLALSRTARKNVQHVYVVGGGWWSSILVTLFSATLLSVKTITSRGKLVQCPSLSSLAESIGGKAFAQIDVPLEVYVANAAVDKAIKLPEKDDQLPRTFGVPLEELAGKDGKPLPRLVRDCLAVLAAEGPASVGIFRRSPSASTVSHLAAAYDRGHPVALSSAPNAPYIAASLLKKFIHDLPDPLIPRDSWDAIKACPLDDDLAVPYLRFNFLPLLPPTSLHLLSRLVSVLAGIAANHSHNLMTSSNLVICLCPALMGGLGASRDELEMCRVPGMEVGSMRGLETIKRRERAGNTLGGVLKVLIDRQSELADSPDPPA